MAVIYTREATIDDLNKIMSIVEDARELFKMIKFLNGKEVIQMNNNLKKI